MPDEIRCPYCNSKDLATVPTPFGESVQTNSTTYKCQICHRTFSKSSSEENKEE